VGVFGLNVIGDIAQVKNRWGDVAHLANTKAENYIFSAATNQGDAKCFADSDYIVKGYDNSTFRPFENLTRGQAAKIISLASTKVQ
jgi:hypothetical protein